MRKPPTLDLIDLGGFCADDSLRIERAEEALDWLRSVGSELADLPGGEAFGALMWLIADEQRRVNRRQLVRAETLAKCEHALAALLRKDWEEQYGRRAA